MKSIANLLILLFLTSFLFAQPQPGDVFREYIWYNELGDAGGSLRVGGRAGYGGGAIPLLHDLDLEHATKAEVVIEKILCHDDTRGLAIQVNDGEWLIVPEAENIPHPQWEYQHHFYPIVPVPLPHFKSGTGNEFRMKVDTTHAWNWPQNLIYGVHFRIYYEPSKKTHPHGNILTPKAGAELGKYVDFTVEAKSPHQRIKQIDYIGYYEDVNFEGDGIYLQWHYHYYHGDLIHHIGTTKNYPYNLRWDASWIPDQKEPMQISARIVDDTNLIYMTEAVTDLKLVRKKYSVELCKPYDIPKKWVTRKGEHEEKFDITGDLNKAVAAQLVWSSWSPGYMNGIYINGSKVFDSEGPHYKYYDHRVKLDDLTAFREGTNTLMTGKTPKYDGHLVHGMEVNWPGIMVLIKYKK